MKNCRLRFWLKDHLLSHILRNHRTIDDNQDNKTHLTLNPPSLPSSALPPGRANSVSIVPLKKHTDICDWKGCFVRLNSLVGVHCEFFRHHSIININLFIYLYRCSFYKNQRTLSYYIIFTLLYHTHELCYVA